jgi:hypothetical protein
VVAFERVSRIDLGVAAVAGLLALSAALLWPVWRSVDPETASAVFVAEEGYGSDPWGRPLRRLAAANYRSVGPNGIDEQGAGDDLVLHWAGGTSFATASGASATPLTRALFNAGELSLLLLAGVLILPYGFLRVAPRPVSKGDKVAAAGFAIAVGVTTSWVGLWMIGSFSEDVTDSLRNLVAIPLPLAAAGTGSLAAAVSMLLVWLAHEPASRESATEEAH